MSPRVLILSWEYPPIIEGGLARHVSKLSEALVRDGVQVHVLTRGERETPSEQTRAGVHIHRVAEEQAPRNLDAFLAWVEGMNSHLHAAGRRDEEHGDDEQEAWQRHGDSRRCSGARTQSTSSAPGSCARVYRIARRP